MIVEACMEGDPQKVFHAVCLDPLTSPCSPWRRSERWCRSFCLP
jgi:hypothetical protein